MYMYPWRICYYVRMKHLKQKGLTFNLEKSVVLPRKKKIKIFGPPKLQVAPPPSKGDV